MVESNQIDDFVKYKYVSNVIDNLKRLFNELLEIRYYVDEEKPHQENNLSVTFTLTNKCNLSCSHCALSASPLSQDILSTNDVKYPIDKIIDVNLNTLILTGGEPFIRNDILEIISYIRTNFKNKLMIMTNGMLIRKISFHLKKRIVYVNKCEMASLRVHMAS
ncbi:radical SAM protein [Staphylococcus epidermidis]|uniref:Coenzyme PQQ synthesis protein E n=2 Tax=root TaxID=1 RepID=W1WRG7_9ZZZZ|nr:MULTISPECIES: radical SAM protein [Staphylococcus]EJE21979.1 hypothetical protein HMPREF9975_10910 [Staphylococcus epidermidis NIHLM001]MCG7793490.1 radical SAM protein [Staphylococcus epidermidis]MCO6198953.1 radical SAM protein [Staphylococcus epidermidis]MCO6257877.1 radical SAM protein [Staphylococcus epidermidis]MDH8927437.1 radical SAM protein [Staphylococcus epidermidis]